MKAISTITVLPQSKEEENNYIEQVKESFLSGYDDPLKMYSQLKRFESIIKSLTKDEEISDYIIDEYEKHNDKKLEIYSAEFTKKETGVKYDFTKCGYSEYDDICMQIEKLTEKKKELETKMKTHKEEWVLEETGEIINPPLKTGTTKVCVKLK